MEIIKSTRGGMKLCNEHDEHDEGQWSTSLPSSEPGPSTFIMDFVNSMRQSLFSIFGPNVVVRVCFDMYHLTQSALYAGNDIFYELVGQSNLGI